MKNTQIEKWKFTFDYVAKSLKSLINYSSIIAKRLSQIVRLDSVSHCSNVQSLELFELNNPVSMVVVAIFYRELACEVLKDELFQFTLSEDVIVTVIHCGMLIFILDCRLNET